MNGHDENTIPITREIIEERVKTSSGDTFQTKRLEKVEREVNGCLEQTQTATRVIPWCSHLAPIQALCCSCGRGYCSDCVVKTGFTCEVCRRFVGKCCAVGSYLYTNRFYCKRCRWFGWFWLLVRR